MLLGGNITPLTCGKFVTKFIGFKDFKVWIRYRIRIIFIKKFFGVSGRAEIEPDTFGMPSLILTTKSRPLYVKSIEDIRK